MFKQIKRLLEAYDQKKLSELGLADKLNALTEINLIGISLFSSIRD